MSTLKLQSVCETLEANEMLSTLNKVVMLFKKDRITADCWDPSVGASLLCTAPDETGSNSIFGI